MALQVLPVAPQLTSDTPTISLSAAAIRGTAQASFTISSGGLPSDFVVTSDSPWLSVWLENIPSALIPFRFTAPQTITVSASATQAAGSYQATLTVAPVVPGLALPLTIPVTLTIASSVPRPQAGPPLPVVIVNAASNLSGPIAAGEILTIFGLNLGPDFPYYNDSPSPPDNVGGTAVRFNGIPGPILFTSPTQTNVIVPASLIGSTNPVSIEAEHAGVLTTAGSYPLVSAVPGIFTILNQDGSTNSATNPALPGSTLQAITTGITFAPNAFLEAKSGGFTFPTAYAPSAPGLFTGQVTFTLPPDSPPGQADLLLAVNFTGERAGHYPLFIAALK